MKQASFCKAVVERYENEYALVVISVSEDHEILRLVAVNALHEAGVYDEDVILGFYIDESDLEGKKVIEPQSITIIGQTERMSEDEFIALEKELRTAETPLGLKSVLPKPRP